MRIDARIPVVFAPVDMMPGDYMVAVDDAGSPHDAGCSCCAPRSEVASLLGGLFFRRARNEVAFFRRVVISAGTEQARRAVEDALESDPVVSATYRAHLPSAYMKEGHGDGHR